jgi:polyhydroxyalkanoate synthesis regulator phasin
LQSQIDMDKCVEHELEHAIDECASEQNKADDEFASRISEYENNVEAGKVIVSLKRRITDLEEEIKELERELKKHRRVESRRRRRRGS